MQNKELQVFISAVLQAYCIISEDIHKLNDTLTRAVCIGTYGVGVFPFRMGDTAFVIDLLKMFIYDSKNDCWLDVEELA